MNSNNILPQKTKIDEFGLEWNTTKLLPLNHAFSFRKCLASNKNMIFARVTNCCIKDTHIVASVEWMPASDKTLRDKYGVFLADRLKRSFDQFSTMTFCEIEGTNGQYMCYRQVSGQVKPREYLVSAEECGCPDYLFRCHSSAKYKCKHMLALAYVTGTLSIDHLSELLTQQTQQKETCNA